MSPDIRLKREYGGVKAALEYCVGLNLNQKQAARMLEIDKDTLRERARRFNVVFPCGYKTRDTQLIVEVQRERLKRENRIGTMGRRANRGIR